MSLIWVILHNSIIFKRKNYNLKVYNTETLSITSSLIGTLLLCGYYPPECTVFFIHLKIKKM